MASENLTTYREMTEHVGKVKEEICEQVNRLDYQVGVMNGKLSQLNDVVLPLTLAMNQTAENTKEISTSLKAFTKTQSVTNGIFTDKMHNHDLAIAGIKSITDGITDKKKYNAGVVVAVIGLVGLFVSGLFGLAPYIFTQ